MANRRGDEQVRGGRQRDRTAYATQYEGVAVTIEGDGGGNPYLQTLNGATTRLNKGGTLAEPFNKGARR